MKYVITDERKKLMLLVASCMVFGYKTAEEIAKKLQVEQSEVEYVMSYMNSHEDPEEEY